ncbi:MAG: 30S ribosome-binding factor RbfA [Pseudomonadota bacterium]|nr:30S ribosome-binding factor RbfA [Pseudomonadota bacterium]|tara:strand:+ start:993 stop:1391 length:399 start_codon:yes stop_codon:yes gene_type:complete
MKNYSFELGRRKSSQRQMKVQEILRAALVEILQRGLTKEPLLDNEMITINYVDVSPDLKHVKFFFLPFNEKKKEDFLEAFRRANKVIRREIGQRVHLKYVPTINFIFDNSITEVRKLDKIFASKKVKKDIER